MKRIVVYALFFASIAIAAGGGPPTASRPETPRFADQYGKWQYRFHADWRYRRAKYTGKLTYAGRPLTARHGQRMWTPWGKMTWLDFGHDTGWMPPTFPEKLPKPAGVEMTSPDPATSKRVRDRHAALEAALDKMVVDLRHVGPADKPFYTLRISAKPERPATYPAFFLVRHVNAAKAREALTALAESGFLARAEKTADDRPVRTVPAYVLEVRTDTCVLRENLGWGLSMIKRLDALQYTFRRLGRQHFSRLLGRLSGLRRQWENAAPKPAMPKQAQGLTGKVVKLVGNFMPGPGPRLGATRTPLSVPVHVFRGKVAPFLKPNRKHPQLVRVVQAGRDGAYRIALPPGEYTAVAEINGRMYLNIQAMGPGGPVWASVQVRAGKWTTFNIADTSKAAF